MFPSEANVEARCGARESRRSPTHPQAADARRTARFLRDHHPHSGQFLNAAIEREACADVIDDLYRRAYLFIPTPKTVWRRLVGAVR